ncbi:unnamed protein product [Diamesa tonsa]
MAEKIEDLNLPLAVISRLVKDALPAGAVVSKEAKMAITRAASVFVLFLTSASTEITTGAGQKIVSQSHVMAALKDVEFGHFEADLQIQLQNYKKLLKDKKDRKSEASSNTNAQANNTTADDDDVQEIEDN